MPNGPGLPNPPPPVDAVSTDPSTPAVQGASLKPIARGGRQSFAPGDGVGVSGTSGTGAGVKGVSQGGDGVLGFSSSSAHSGVSGINTSGGQAGQGGPGVYGSSSNMDGVQGWSHSSQNAGVSATNDNGGYGVWASATGPNPNSGGIAGYFKTDGNVALQAISTAEGFDAIVAQSHSSGHAAVSAQNGNGGYGLWAWSPKGRAIYGNGTPAGYFEGNVEVTGTLNVDSDITMPAADFAEDFPVQASVVVEPGTVMALDENGMLRPSEGSYDRKVAGVVSGAGDYRPGLILDRQKFSVGRLPLALVGKVYCKVDATYGAIEVGDLLTTSPTSGHAMKASDPLLAFGAVLGKALRSLASGQGMIPILVALQ